MKKRVISFRWAFKGVKTVFLTQPNFKIHCFIGFLVVLAGFWLKVTQTEWILLVLCIAAVLAAEMFNSAIEFIVDLASPEYHKLAGAAKDSAAGAVLITAVAAAIIGLLILIPYFLEKI